MAEPTHAPALPSTADATPYVPVSWMAVAADAVAGLYATLLLILGYVAFTNKKPLLQHELLVLPVVAVVLSFAARRMIRNSEGTRTGEQLANGAWWTAVVLGLGYVAYLLGIDYSVRQDAAAEAKKWVALVQEEKTDRAFYQTIPPGGRQGIAKDDTSMLKARFRDELLSFTTSDLMKLAQRNRGEFEYTPGGVASWRYVSGTIDCTFAGVVKCPEGHFPVLIPLKGVEGVTAGDGGGGGGRQWMIVRPQTGGFIQQDKAERTPYGWLVVQLEGDGGGFGKAYVDTAALGPGVHAYLYQGFVAEGGNLGEWFQVIRNPLYAIAFAAPLGVTSAATGRGYTQHLATNFFRLPGGAEPTPAQRDKFVASWNALGLLEAGKRLKDAGGGVPDKELILKLTDAAIEVHVPVELPLLSSGGRTETARGRLVVACSDPALLAEVKARKAAAKTDKVSGTFTEEVAWKAAIPWRVVRIESDLAPVNMVQPGGSAPGAGGGAGH